MTQLQATVVRRAEAADLTAIRHIYNEGIEDRIATLDEDPKSEAEIAGWYREHGDRFSVFVAERGGRRRMGVSKYVLTPLLA